jgi:tetratricopeptide (TPR) repeat protein
LYSARDVIGWSVESVLEDLRQLPARQVELAPTVSTRTQAMQLARTVAQQRSTPALRAFLDSTRRDPQELRQLAAYAAMNGGDGAMALLLAAEKRRPGDWATQYNIAVFLNLEGYPTASKVLLDSLQAPADARAPGDIDLRATLLLGRGNALIAMGRPQQAIPLLREARQREPVLSEASRSLALAQLLTKQEQEAKRSLRLGGRRFASRAEMEAADEMPPVIDAGDDDVEEVLLLEAFRNRDGSALTLNDRWPLYKGRGQSL